ncbi:MAG: HipA family kinase [Wolinella sp.]
MRTYHLKNKDDLILKFEVDSVKTEVFGKTTYEQILISAEILNNRLPITIDKDDLKNSLKKWIEVRKIPSNRQFVEKIVASYGGSENNFMDYIDVSLALSLNDTFWVTPADSDYKWSDYNLYENKFDEALSLVAFSGMSHKVSGFTSSPEYTTNGMLRKCWHRHNDEIYLLKGSGETYANGGKEAYSEFYMAQVAKALSLEYTDYGLTKFHEQIVSFCKLFTSQKEGYMPIYYLLSKDERKSSGSALINAISEIYRKDKLRDLLLFDAIIYNTDRHLGNFGMMVNNDTGGLIRPAPIFDNGLSMMNSLTKDELKDISAALSKTMSFFRYDFDTQLKLAVDERHLDGLERLSKFEFAKHAEFNLDDEWLFPVQEHIKERAKKAIYFYEEIEQNRHTNTKRLRR